mgnify:CR=1 FL=1
MKDLRLTVKETKKRLREVGFVYGGSFDNGDTYVAEAFPEGEPNRVRITGIGNGCGRDDKAIARGRLISFLEKRIRKNA